MGLSASGTGFGTLLYAPFTQWILQSYGWRDASLILGGTLLLVCFCGALMRDPDWLIEENKLESQSQGMLTVSNSIVFLGDIKKMLETGAPGETVLDTLVTNVNTEANQQIQDLDDVYITRKYHSEQQLPTYLCSHDCILSMENTHCSSRRSLRNKNSEHLSKDNIFSTSTLKSPQQNSNDTFESYRHLASAETLNASEKNSSSNQASDGEIDRILEAENTNGKYGSRLSLDETQLKKWRENKTQLVHDLRGNSLGTLLENDNVKRQNDEIKIFVPLFPNNLANEQSAIKHKLHNRHHKHHHQYHHHHHNTGEIVSNLRRNVPLRNSHHFHHMRIHRNSINYRNAMMNTHRYRMKASSCPNIYRNSMTTLAKETEEVGPFHWMNLI